MAALIESDASLLARAQSDIATPAAVGCFNGAKLHLVKTLVAIDKNTALATLTGEEADFTGYSAGTLIWDVPGFSDDNAVEVVSTPLIFRPTDAVIPNNIYAVFISDSGTTKWFFAGPVDDPPIPLPDALHQVIVTVRYRPGTPTFVVTIS